MKQIIFITRGKNGKRAGFSCNHPVLLIFFATFICLAFVFTTAVNAAPEKKPKPAAEREGGAVSDANLGASIKKVDDLLKKNEYNVSLRTTLKIHDYTKEVLAMVRFIKGQYEKAVNDPAVPQKDKEQLYLKLKTLGQLVPKYTSAYENSLYNLGYIYSKRGESERARKYLTEYLQTTQFSTNRDSKWMKAKTLLLGLYSLEGEF